MTRIRFEDLPSTNTPRNAENLNKLNNVVISSTEPTTGEEVWIQKGKNLIDKTKIIIGYELLGNGGLQTNNDWFVTDYIKVEPNKQYCISGIFSDAEGLTASIYIEFYDENRNYISGVRENPTTTPSNAKYVRLNGITSVSENMMLEQNSTATNYEPYVEKKIYTKNDNRVYEEFYDEEKTNKVNYSTNEQVIGTWIDGKPLYRKVINGTFPNSTGDVALEINFENIDNGISMRGFTFYSTTLQSKIPLNNYIDETHHATIYEYTANGRTSLRAFIGTAQVGVPYTIIYEYTKTTD